MSSPEIGDFIEPSRLFYVDWPLLKPGIRRIILVNNDSVKINKSFDGAEVVFIVHKHYKVIKKTKLLKLLYG